MPTGSQEATNRLTPLSCEPSWNPATTSPGQETNTGRGGPEWQGCRLEVAEGGEGGTGLASSGLSGPLPAPRPQRGAHQLLPRPPLWALTISISYKDIETEAAVRLSARGGLRPEPPAHCHLAQSHSSRCLRLGGRARSAPAADTVVNHTHPELVTGAGSALHLGLTFLGPLLESRHLPGTRSPRQPEPLGRDAEDLTPRPPEKEGPGRASVALG